MYMSKVKVLRCPLYQNVFAVVTMMCHQFGVNDKCFFYKEGFLLVLYVKNRPDDIDKKLLNNLQAKGFEMMRESSFEEFLDIKFVNDEETDSITLTQKGLINKIINATGMENCNPNWVPAVKEGLSIDQWRANGLILEYEEHHWYAPLSLHQLSSRRCLCRLSPTTRSNCMRQQ
jgi:hypothetical protein